MTWPLGIALALVVVFVVAVWREPRRFRNAVLLGLAATFLLLEALPGLEGAWAPLAYALLVLPALGAAGLGVALVVNGVVMVRREGVCLSHLLSLVAGAALLVGLVLVWAAIWAPDTDVPLLVEPVVLIGAYASFLFGSFLVYGFLYARLPVAPDAAVVIVLGAGLLDGDRVSPLLAGRLQRGHEVFTTLAAAGREPLLITSGGQGPDERLPEAHAMADHLLTRGLPPAALLREDRSRTTRENLRFSRALAGAHRPGASCVIVTSDYHALRASFLARAEGLRGNAVGSRTARYYWPTAVLREFAAVLSEHRRVHLAVCGLLLVPAVLAWLT